MPKLNRQVHRKRKDVLRIKLMFLLAYMTGINPIKCLQFIGLLLTGGNIINLWCG